MKSIVQKLMDTYKKEGLKSPEQHFIKAADTEKEMLFQLLGKEHNDFEPACYLRECGIYTFALTIGGHAICIDSNSGSIYICDHGLIMQDFDTDAIVINSGLVSCDVYDSFHISGEIPFNYDNIIICMDKIENSFLTFMENVADGNYTDLEKLITY